LCPHKGGKSERGRSDQEVFSSQEDQVVGRTISHEPVRSPTARQHSGDGRVRAGNHPEAQNLYAGDDQEAGRNKTVEIKCQARIDLRRPK
jgi:hypothetical protein